jgi:hypothetical protein
MHKNTLPNSNIIELIGMNTPCEGTFISQTNDIIVAATEINNNKYTNT